MSDGRKPFFVGYLPIPAGLGGFLVMAALVLVAGFAALGLAIGTTQDDPGPGAYRFDYGRQTLTGVIEMDPYPLLHVTKGTDRIPAGSTVMMSGGGKFGVGDRVAPHAGGLAQISGVIIERGTLHLLQVAGGGGSVRGAEGDAPDIEVQDLGRWRLSGEICDGKCLAGSMRPGRGLAHKACANLCILGEVPPVFVSSQPVEGSEFLMIGSKDGKMLPPALYDYVGQFVELEAAVERRGGVLVMRVDTDTVRVLK